MRCRLHGSRSGCSEGMGRDRTDSQPAPFRHRSTNNRHAAHGSSPNSNLCLEYRLIYLQSCPSTIHIHFRSCRKVRSRFYFWSLHPLIQNLSYCLYTRLRHLWCRFRHRCSFFPPRAAHSHSASVGRRKPSAVMSHVAASQVSLFEVGTDPHSLGSVFPPIA